jgi:hypothetical protein
MGFLDKMKDAANQASKAASMGTGMGAADVAAYQQKAQKLNQSGVNHPATVKGMAPTGNTDPGGGREIRFDVEVQPERGAPYATSFTQFMMDGSMGGVGEGSVITVRVDPDDPNSMLFWGAAAP